MSKGRDYAIERIERIERIEHIIVSANYIQSYTGRGRSEFDSDSAIRDAIRYQIIVIGEPLTLLGFILVRPPPIVTAATACSGGVRSRHNHADSG